MEDTPSATMIECPFCAEQINAKSKKCRHCGEILDPQMREIEFLKSQRNTPNVFMNAGGGGGGAASASSASGGQSLLRRFPHWLHIILSLISGGLWIPIYVLMYAFRNKRYYF